MNQPRAPRIDRATFEHLVDLAQLRLSGEEAEYLLEQLNAQLVSIRELDAIEVPTDTPISSHGVPYSPASGAQLRPDAPAESELADEIVAGAPETKARYIVVPDIPHEDL